MSSSLPAGRRSAFQSALPPYLYMLPALLVYGVFVLYPIVRTLWLSLYEWTGFTDPDFVGPGNYAALLRDDVFLKALTNNLKFIAFFTVFPIAIGLLLTAIMTRRRLFGLTVFRAGFFIPYVMPMVVVGVVWRWIYNPVFGPLNESLRFAGLDLLARPWLGDYHLALPAVGLIGTWAMYGFCMALFIAGVQSIDEAIYDAAMVDGANEWRQLRHITIPGIRAEIAVAAVTTFIAALRIFDLVFVTTRGGPAEQTMVTSMWLYRNAFQINRAGYAASIAVVQTVIILAISYLLLTRIRNPDEEEGA